MRTQLERIYWTLRDGLRNKLWPIPVASIFVALLLGSLLPVLERASGGQLFPLPDVGTFNGDPDAARTLLSSISSSLITVTSLTFSLTVVTLQLASSQFSPRLLRTFTQDLFVQATLGVFLATFVYSLTVLRAVQSQAEGRAAFVPRVSVVLAFVLAMASVVMLVAFLAHLTRQIRVETMVLTVREDAMNTIRVVLDDLPDREEPEPLPEPHDGVVFSRLMAPASGFYTGLDTAELTSTAAELGVTVSLEPVPGEFLVQDTPVGRVWRADGVPVSAEDLDRIQACLAGALTTGPERTSAEDVSYGLRQLTDVANKALSPGINDPTTAIHALGHISTVLCALAVRRLGPVSFGDPEGHLWVGVNRPGMAYLLDVAIGQVRHYGVSDVQVASRLLTLLGDVAWCVSPDDRDAVRHELAMMRRAIDRQELDDADVAKLAGLAAEVDSRLER